jgi:hypothetical protein
MLCSSEWLWTHDPLASAKVWFLKGSS